MRITKIVFKKERQKYWVYVDNKYCTSIRERTFPAMKLEVGQEISCEQIKKLENYHWKHKYGATSWEEEKTRIDKVKKLIKSINQSLSIETIGFGTNSIEFIESHPKKSGAPDISVSFKGRILLHIEVSGTKYMRGANYWVRPDKLEYFKAHPDKDIWIILCYSGPREKLVFIKPDSAREYSLIHPEIRGSIEKYIEFKAIDAEVKNEQDFVKYLQIKLADIADDEKNNVRK